MDFTKVPGVLLSNRKIEAQAPALTDIAPTILSEFGIAKTKEMLGQSVFQSRYGDGARTLNRDTCRTIVILSEAKDPLLRSRRKAGPSLRSG